MTYDRSKTISYGFPTQASGDAMPGHEQSGGPVCLQGYLDTGSVIDLVQFLVQSAKTGRLKLYPEDGGQSTGACSLFMQHGNIVHAEDGKVGGQQALWKALSISQGNFMFFYDDRTHRKTIHANPMELLMEFCRRKDETAIRLPGNTNPPAGNNVPAVAVRKIRA
jgi:hypothetical protein